MTGRLFITIFGLFWVARIATGQEAAADLQAALTRLSEQRTAIAAEKASLVNRLDEWEARLRERRRAWELLRLETGVDENRRSAREANVAAMEAEIATLESALDDYQAHLETNLHAAELPAYADLAAELREEESVAGRWQKVARFGASRLGELTGGQVLAGEAVSGSGEVLAGTFLLWGPLAFFAPDSGASGSAIPRDGIKPLLVPFSSAEHGAALDQILAGGVGALPLDPSGGRAIKTQAERATFIQQLKLGGVWVWPIVGLAVIATVVALLKLVQIVGASLAGKRALPALWDCLEQGNLDGAGARVEGMPEPLRALMVAALSRRDHSREALEDALLEQVIRWQIRWERGLPVLAVAAAVAPLLGLLGTVTGMIETFRVIGIQGGGQARPLAGGIAEALITTELGLMVAIPALIAHAVLARKAQSLVADLEGVAAALVEQLTTRSSPKGGAPDG